MEISTQTLDILILIAIIFLLASVLTLLVLWARKGNKGANLVAATFTFLAPDPTFEKNIRIIKESEQQVRKGDEDSGDPPSI